VAGGGADEGGDNNVFANAPLRPTAKIPARKTTRPRMREQGIRFRDDGPVPVYFLPDRFADKPAVIVKICARNINCVITDVGIEACFSESVSCDADESKIRIARAGRMRSVISNQGAR
jgi:hypothetical protein